MMFGNRCDWSVYLDVPFPDVAVTDCPYPFMLGPLRLPQYILERYFVLFIGIAGIVARPVSVDYPAANSASRSKFDCVRDQFKIVRFIDNTRGVLVWCTVE